MVVYTKTGDKGETGLFRPGANKKIRVSKDSTKINALGAVDELNSFIGVTVAASANKELKKTLNNIQRNLLTLGSILAGSKLRFFASKTTQLEKLIDKMDKELPPLNNFILPGGSVTAANLQFCRSLTRRAERALVALNKIEPVKPQILKYINRLSDFFFMLARQANFDEGVADVVWITKKKK
ncbi:ATP:cob(I)alamin adenosyltransferase [Candidatus Woesebacteria bacterium GWA1_41_8]|uniref:Corrinoid adenosyltransferase n=1 Tax=Candidatus Woesebacteria bacterium GWA1_41_8 TaxID=1802471 RepID=A0A1F7WIR3_9BACT|nr:MAG: ATP:cob(I)alamin adenosyltransferase [Candidatus Woesebacteria bacterium GWA1_41_8]